MNFYLEKMNELGADGVDFHACFAKPPHCSIYQSNTKEDFENSNIGTPRSGYTFWKIIEGKKIYIDFKTGNEITESITQSYKFGEKVMYISPNNPSLKTPCVFIRDDCGKAVIIFESAEWVARVNYKFLSK